ncbi:hypothetical protein [Burkholderia ubonensis]|nr:hypothetical protein [Burkholderia ubonensis]
MERLTETIDAVDGYQVSLHVELTREPNERVATLRSTLVARSGTEARSVVTLFNVLPPSLVSFVRRTRKFLDYANVRIDRAVPQLSALADGHFRYFPSEGDRLSDGARVDHVPALTMIDIALSVGTARNPGALDADISAQFLSYADPRQPFDIVPGDAHGVVAFMQNDQRVAEIRCRERVGA